MYILPVYERELSKNEHLKTLKNTTNNNYKKPQKDKKKLKN